MLFIQLDSIVALDPVGPTPLRDTAMDTKELKKEAVENAYGVAAPLNASTLTLGCEFEFVLMYPRAIMPKAPYTHGMDLVRDTISPPRKMKCAGHLCEEEFELCLPVVVKEVNASHEYDKWEVSYDGSVIPQSLDDLQCLGNSKQLEKFQFDPIEVRSRILRYEERSERASSVGKHEHWVTFQDEITMVLSLLNEKFGFGRKDVMHSGYHIFATQQSAFQVHIANGEHLSVPFETAKKVYSTFIACERQLDRLSGTKDLNGVSLATVSPKTPIPGASDLYSYLLRKTYNKPLSVNLITAAHMRRQWEYVPRDKSLLRALKGDKDVLDELYPQTVSKTMKNFDDVKFGMDIDSC